MDEDLPFSASTLALAEEAGILQEKLLGLEVDDLEILRNEILVSEHLMTQNGIESFINILLKGVELRVGKVSQYAQLLSAIFHSENAKKVKDRIKDILITRFFSFSFLPLCHPHQMNYSYFGYLCYTHRIINGKDILSGMQFYPVGGQMDQMAHNISWFGPEIEIVDQKFLSIHCDLLVKNRHFLVVPNIFHDDTYKAGWQAVEKLRSNGHSPNSICAAIVADDPAALHNALMELPNASVNISLPKSVFEPCFLLKDSPTPIQYAAARGSVECFKYLLINGADLTMTDEAGRKITQFAIYGGNIEIIRIIEDTGFKFSNCTGFAVQYHRNDILTWILSSSGGVPKCHMRSILMNAAIANNVNAALVGFMNQNDVNGRDSETEEFVITNAAVHGSGDVLSLLLDHPGINTSVRGKFGSPLQSAVQFGYIEVTRRLMKYDMKAVDTLSDTNITCLHTAAEQNFGCVIEVLLEKPDVNVNVVDPVLGSPFQLAVVFGNAKAAKALMAHPCLKMNVVDTRGNFPYFLSVVSNNISMVKLILGDTRSLVQMSPGDCSALVFAIRNNLMGIVNVLMTRPDCGMNCAHGTDRKTPLMIAIEEDLVPAVSLLLQHPRVDVNMPDAFGRTALHYACLKEDATFTKMILNMRDDVNLNICDRDGRTPLHVATILSKLETLSILLDRTDINMTIRDTEGRTALEIAMTKESFVRQLFV